VVKKKADNLVPQKRTFKEMKRGSRKKSQNKLIAFADNEIMLKNKEYIKSLYFQNG
jgi:hypothetical protein